MKIPKIEHMIWRYFVDSSNTKFLNNWIRYNPLVIGSVSFLNLGLYPVSDRVSKWGKLPCEEHSVEIYECISSTYCTFAKVDNPRTILEIGCGIGGGLQYLSYRFPDAYLTGLDLSLVGLKRANKVTNASLLAGDAHNLPLSNDRFDLVTAVETAHMFDLTIYMREVSRILAPRGLYIMIDIGLGTAEFQQQRYSKQAEYADMECILFIDLTDAMLQAVEHDKVRREKLLRWIPPPFRFYARNTAVLPGTQYNQEYQNGRRCYFMCVLRKSNCL